MRYLFTALTLFISFAAYAQKKDTLVRYFNAELEPVKKKEAVFVGVAIKDAFGWNALVYNDSLKVIMRGKYESEDCQVKNGWFIYYNSKGDRYLAGKYTKNMRTDLWQTWFPSGQIKDSIYFNNDQAEGLCRRYFANGSLESTGFYKAGQPDSNWVWYHENGQIATKEKYTRGRMSSLECFDSTGAPLGMNCAINRPPAIKGRYGGIEKYLTDSLSNFDKLNFDEQKNVYLQLTVDRTGVMAEPVFHFVQEPVLVAEVKRVLKAVPGWYPAVSHNRNTDHTFRLNILFYPEKQGVQVTNLMNPLFNLPF